VIKLEFTTWEELLSAIENERCRLYEAYQHESLNSKKLIEISRRLDKLIAIYQGKKPYAPFLGKY